MAGLLDRQGVVGLLGPTLDPNADPDEFRRAFHDMIAFRPHLTEMPPYQIVEDANGTAHLVRREPLDRPPPDLTPLIDAGAPSRVAGLPMRGDRDAARNATRPLHLAQAPTSAPQERAPINPPAAVSDDPDKGPLAQPPQVAPGSTASPDPSAASPAPGPAAAPGEAGATPRARPSVPTDLVGASKTKEVFDSADAAKSFGIGLAKGGIGLVGTPGDLWAYVNDGETPLPTSAGIRRKVETVTGPFHQPRTLAGELSETLGEFAPAALVGPGTLARRLAVTGAAAVGSEAVGQALKDSPYEKHETIGRVVGAVGGGAPAALWALPRLPATRHLALQALIARQGTLPARIDD